MASKTDQWEVRSFGRDCLGNISGYVVARGHGWNREIAGTFVGNIYEPGSFARAEADANVLLTQVAA